MKLAFITDIHANREAFTAVLAHAATLGATHHVFLGDYVGYGADPAWVVDRVAEFVARGAPAVIGNHDAAVVRGPSASMRPEPRRAIAWTREQLSPAQVSFLASRPYAATDGDRLYVHANAFAPMDWGYIVSRNDATRSLLSTDCRYTFCGHVHEPALYHLSAAGRTGDYKPTPEVGIPVPPQRQWLVLPGSAGQPRDGNPAACYATLDVPTGVLTYHRVPYDHDTAAAKIRAAGLPESFAERLIHGE